MSETYYETGDLKERAIYEEGKLVSKVEFYADGRKRFELDLSDARQMEGNPEVGIGKLYWANGNIKYEWHMTGLDPIGFKKSYNRDGSLRQALYYDENNELIEQR